MLSDVGNYHLLTQVSSLSFIERNRSGCDMEHEYYVRLKTCFIYVNSISMWMCRMWEVLITCSISDKEGSYF